MQCSGCNQLHRLPTTSQHVHRSPCFRPADWARPRSIDGYTTQRCQSRQSLGKLLLVVLEQQQKLGAGATCTAGKAYIHALPCIVLVQALKCFASFAQPPSRDHPSHTSHTPTCHIICRCQTLLHIMHACQHICCTVFKLVPHACLAKHTACMQPGTHPMRVTLTKNKPPNPSKGPLPIPTYDMALRVDTQSYLEVPANSRSKQQLGNNLFSAGTAAINLRANNQTSAAAGDKSRNAGQSAAGSDGARDAQADKREIYRFR